MVDSQELKTAGRYLFGKEKKSVGAPVLTKVLARLNKADLVEFASRIKENCSKLNKKEVIRVIVENTSKKATREFLNGHKRLLAIQPTVLEEILDCSKAERLRWTEEGKLTVIGQEPFTYGTYPVFDWLEIIQISYSPKVEKWREHHEQQKARNRSKAAKKAASTRRSQAKTTNNEKFFEIEEAAKLWKSLALEQASHLELAYWCLLARSQVRQQKEKALTARKRGLEYQALAKQLEELFDSCLAILVAAPGAELKFNLSEEPELLIWDHGYWRIQEKLNSNRMGGFFSLKLSSQDSVESFTFFIAKGRGRNIFPPCNRLPSVPMTLPHAEREMLAIDGKVVGDLKRATPNSIKQAISKIIARINQTSRCRGKELNFQLAAATATEQYAKLEKEWAEKVKMIRDKLALELIVAKSDWQSVSSVSDYLELAYWTTWISRAAKSFQQAGNSQRSQELYLLKNQALSIINVCPNAKLSFYRPINPDRVRWESSYWIDPELVPIDGQVVGEDWETGRVKVAQGVTREKDYYSLFSTEISHPDLPNCCFSFHTPYPLGISLYPNPDFLASEDHSQNENFGEFRFGRPLTEEEMIALSAEEIKSNLNEVLKRFSPETVAQLRESKFLAIKAEAKARQERLKILSNLPVSFDMETVEEVYLSVVNKKGNKRKHLAQKLGYLLEITEEIKSYPEYKPSYVKEAINRWIQQSRPAIAQKIGVWL